MKIYKVVHFRSSLYRKPIFSDFQKKQQDISFTINQWVTIKMKQISIFALNRDMCVNNVYTNNKCPIFTKANQVGTIECQFRITKFIMDVGDQMTKNYNVIISSSLVQSFFHLAVELGSDYADQVKAIIILYYNSVYILYYILYYNIHCSAYTMPIYGSPMESDYVTPTQQHRKKWF